MAIQIKKIGTWTEKNKDFGYASGSLRIYIGGMCVGWAEPVREDKDRYRYRSRILEDIIRVPTERQTLEEIIMHVELSLKEFIKRVALIRSL